MNKSTITSNFTGSPVIVLFVVLVITLSSIDGLSAEKQTVTVSQWYEAGLVAALRDHNTQTLVAAMNDDSDLAVMNRAALQSLDLPTKSALSSRLANLAANPSEADDDVRVAAVKGLGFLANETAIDAIFTLLRDHDFKISGAAVDSVSELNGSNINTRLLNLLNDPDPYVRSAAVQALGSRGDKSAISTLQALLDDQSENTMVRINAHQSLIELGDKGLEPALLDSLKSPNLSCP